MSEDNGWGGEDRELGGTRRIARVTREPALPRTEASRLEAWAQIRGAGLLGPPTPKRSLRQRIRDAWRGMVDGWRWGHG